MSRKADNDAVTQAYLKRIVGYEVTETKEEYKVNDDGELELLKKTEKTKHIPGDPRAAEFWLTNRQKKRWKWPRFLGGEDVPKAGEMGVIEIPEVPPIDPQVRMDRSVTAEGESVDA